MKLKENIKKEKKFEITPEMEENFRKRVLEILWM